MQSGQVSAGSEQTWDFRLPDIGEGVVEGEIVRWLVNEGDEVREDQPLVEVMTDKATVTIPSPRRGRVLRRHGAEGSVAKVREPLVTLAVGESASATAPAAVPGPARSEPVEPREAAAQASPAAAPPPVEPALASAGAGAAVAAGHVGARVAGGPAVASAVSGAPAQETPGPRTAPPGQPSAPAAPTPRAAARGGRVLATPLTRRIAREYGLDLHEVPGSGPQGRVLKRDVLAAIEARRAAAVRPAAPARPEAPRPAAPPAPALSEQARHAEPSPAARQTRPERAEDRRMPVRGLRRAIFRKMAQSEAHSVPFTYVDEVDCTELVALRRRLNERLAGAGGPRLTYLPFVVKALVAALRRFPHLNAVMDEAAEELILRGDYNIGIGVATDAGLTVAVLRRADRLTMGEIAAELDRLARTAREGKLVLEDLQGSTFTITSLGRDGGMFATPVVNHPEVGILGIHRIEPRPVVVGGQVVVRERMYLSCTFDHRVIDGHVGAAFVQEIKRRLEAPDLLMLEMA